MPANDDPVWPLATALLDCLCSVLPDTLRGAVCDCCVYPGDDVPMDNCCACAAGEGQAWIRVGRVFRTGGRFPDPATLEENCKIGAWAVELTMGVYRCAATIDDSGNAPACAVLEGDAQALLSDGAALRQAATCCFPPLLDDLNGGRYVVGDTTFLTPTGGCMGTQMDMTVEFFDCCPPAP